MNNKVTFHTPVILLSKIMNIYDVRGFRNTTVSHCINSDKLTKLKQALKYRYSMGVKQSWIFPRAILIRIHEYQSK